MKEMFIEFVRPFLCKISKELDRAGGVMTSVDRNKPNSVKAGEFWDDVNGFRYFFNGKISIPAFPKTPTRRLNIGDAWVDTSTPSFEVKIYGTIESTKPQETSTKPQETSAKPQETSATISVANVIEIESDSISQIEVYEYLSTLTQGQH